MQNNTQHLNKNTQQLFWPRTQFLILHQSRWIGAAFFHFFFFSFFLEVHPTSGEPQKISRQENLKIHANFSLKKTSVLFQKIFRGRASHTIVKRSSRVRGCSFFLTICFWAQCTTFLPFKFSSSSLYSTDAVIITMEVINNEKTFLPGEKWGQPEGQWHCSGR